MKTLDKTVDALINEMDKDEPDIQFFFHCRKCMEDLPFGESPKDYQRIQVGITNRNTVLVWCNRHDMEVGELVLADPMLEELECEHCKEKEVNTH